MSETPPHDIEIFASKAEAAWSVIGKQYADRMTPAELDHLFACFVLGLTTPHFGEKDSRSHYEICQSLISIKLPQERTEAALHTVPQASQPWVESARQLIESKGATIGHTLLQRTHTTKETAGEDANSSPPERLVNSEEKS